MPSTSPMKFDLFSFGWCCFEMSTYTYICFIILKKLQFFLFQIFMFILQMANVSWWFFFSKVIELLDTVCILKQYCNRSFNKRFICLRFTSHLPVSRFEYKQNLTFNEIINIVYILKFDCALPCCLYNTNI